ncbi:MAG TPA: GNAT family N-acetyltransferase [Tepidisphaeraceae bacterium]|nr:GNAT family N-acetyltransferase [Tepidisphaeraceae bacterium]
MGGIVLNAKALEDGCTMIREMESKDCERVSELLEQLGYPTPLEQVVDRFNRLDQVNHRLFVAECEQGVVGWAHAAMRSSITSQARIEIVALVVDERHRRKGIGRELLRRIEDWSREAGLDVVRVTSNLARQESHALYLASGYALEKKSAVYSKRLPKTVQTYAE